MDTVTFMKKCIYCTKTEAVPTLSVIGNCLCKNTIIFIQVYDAHLLPGHNVLKAMNLVAGSTVGVFKCDIGTVYAAPGKHSSFITV